MDRVIEITASALILFTALIALIVSIRQLMETGGRRKKKNHDALKKVLFGYSINGPDTNLVDTFTRSADEMVMSNNGSDHCREEPDFRYYDYFVKLKDTGKNDHND